jgi:hypothetical protein
VAESNPDGMGRPSRAPGAQQANAEEMLAELVRLVESSAFVPERAAPPVEIVREPKQTDSEPLQPLEMTSLRPSVDPPPGKPRETLAVDVEPPPARAAANSYSNHPKGIDLATGQRSGAWTFKVSALVLAGAAVAGSIFWLKYLEPGPAKTLPLIATAQAPTKAQPRSDLTVATSSDAGMTALKDITQPAVVSPEERPIDRNASVSLNNPPPSGPTAVGAAQPTADASAGKPPAAPVDTPGVAAPIAASPALASQTLDPKPVPVPTVPLPPAPMTTVPVPLPPDPAQIATPAPSATNPGVAAPASDAPLPPARPAPKAAIDAAGVAQRSTPKSDLPTKLSGKSAAPHVVVAKADATGPSAPAETPSQPLRRGAPVKPATGAKTLDAAQATAEAQAAPPEQPPPVHQPNPNPVMHAFNSMVGAVTGLIPFVPH